MSPWSKRRCVSFVSTSQRVSHASWASKNAPASKRRAPRAKGESGTARALLLLSRLQQVSERAEARSRFCALALSESLERGALLVVLQRAQREADPAFCNLEHLGPDLGAERKRLAQVRAAGDSQLHGRRKTATGATLRSVDLD